MIRLNLHRIDRANGNTPVLYNHEIDEYAQAVIEDYKPELLKEPKAVRFGHFLESYLDMRIEYQHIYNKDPERPILAMTAFEKGRLKVFDKENKCTGHVFIQPRTVVIDNIVTKPGMEGLALFSGLHEGGHITMHGHIYADRKNYAGEFKPDENISVSPVVCCRRDSIEKFGKTNGKKLRTAKEWREHQANYFAAAMAMPNATFKPFVNQLMRENGYYRSSIILGQDGDWDILADEILPDAISEVYGVSKHAARIKLKTCGFVIGNI